MLRNGETWKLEEPELNDYGIPIIHDVSRVLGCIRGPQDDVWSWPGRYSDFYDTKPRTHLAHPEFREDKQMTHSEAHHSSDESGRLSSLSQKSETPFTIVETAAHSRIQQEDLPLSRKRPMQTHQGLQQKPDINISDILMQETQDYESNSPFFPMEPLDGPPHQFSTPETDVFDTRETANSLLSDIPPVEIDWTTWRDLVPFENICTVRSSGAP